MRTPYSAMSIWTTLYFVIIFSSCGASRFIAPPYTDVDKIVRLETGLNLNEVSEILKIRPYDIVYAHDTRRKLLVYNYRVRDRNLAVASRSANQVVHTEDGQRQGERWYDGITRELYILFKNDTLSGIYSERFASELAYMERLGDQESQSSLTYAGSEEYAQAIANGDIGFLHRVFSSRFQGGTGGEIREDEFLKRRRKTLRWVAIGGGLVLLTIVNAIF
ncbi:MAG: hypothetical protein AAFV95_17445 [Bacteroidota bacterium]